MASKQPIEDEKLDRVTGGNGGTPVGSEVETTSSLKCDQSPTGFHVIENYADCICIHCHKKVEMKQTPGGTFA